MCPTGDPYQNKSGISRRSECYKYKICDAPNPKGPLTTRQLAETLVNVG